MKKLTIICFLFFTVNVFAQDPSGEEFYLMMQEFPQYVSFNNMDKLDGNVQSCKDMVEKLLASKGENIEDYYVGNDMVIRIIYQGGELHKGENLSFPIFHIETFKALLKFKKANPEKYKEYMKGLNPMIDMVGNASGKDGLIQIYYESNEAKWTIFK